MKKTRIVATGMALALALPCTYGFPVNASNVKFDINGDGSFNLSDIVTIRQYLIGNSKIQESADINGDGTVDVIDYIEMRKELLKGIKSAEEDSPESARNLCAGIESSDITGMQADKDFILGQTKFALNLLKCEINADENADKNVLLSSYSIAQALGMTANGAVGQTKQEMENVIGGMPMEMLNEYFYTQRTSQQNNEYCKVLTANSIWARESRIGSFVCPEFIQKNVDYYNSDYFLAPFDNTTVDDINNWISNKTNEMIDNMIDDIDEYTQMFLINAVYFDAQWEEGYSEYQVADYDFHTSDGSIQNAQMLCSQESYYLEDENAVGFYKNYYGNYAFVALLPNEDMTLDEYIETLTPEKLNAVLSDKKNDANVIAKIPKFKTGYNTSLVKTLCKLGMPSAFFDGLADFSKIVPSDIDPLHIGDVLHKTYIDLNESGTKAAAATAVIMKDNCVPELPEKTIEITLDRPFLYCIINTETNLPIFIGTLNNLNDSE